jgi:hypothetical protein
MASLQPHGWSCLMPDRISTDAGKHVPRPLMREVKVTFKQTGSLCMTTGSLDRSTERTS